MGTAPGQWLAVSDTLANGALAEDLAATLAGLASITDQSDGRAAVRISGPRARDVLAKGLPIDLHPKAFRPGDAATTVASLIGVQLWQVDDGPTYDVAMFRGYAGSFWHWLTASAAEFGYVIEA
jgi:sarcosine oxidase subunit gamma